jgi:hypothetical protein
MHEGALGDDWNFKDVLKLADAAGRAFDANASAASETLLDRLSQLYAESLSRPGDSGWNRLPPLEAVCEAVVAAYSDSGRRGDAERRLLRATVGNLLAGALESVMPRLAELREDGRVGLDALQRVAGHVRDERERIAAAAPKEGILARIRARLNPADVMKETPDHVLSAACAGASLRISADAGMSPDPRIDAEKATALANLAERYLSPEDRGAISLVHAAGEAAERLRTAEAPALRA